MAFHQHAPVTEEFAIKEVRFSVLSPEEIDNLSTVTVTNPNLYSKGIPNQQTPVDLRLGSSDRRLRCSTCRNSSSVCAGHSGKIDLAIPVVSWLFQDSVLKILRCVCFWCSSVLIDTTDPSMVRKFAKFVGGKRLSAISSYCKGKKCTACKGPQPEWDGKGGLVIKAKWPVGTEFGSKEDEEYAQEEVTAEVIRNILKYISDDHTTFLGTKNPEFMNAHWYTVALA